MIFRRQGQVWVKSATANWSASEVMLPLVDLTRLPRRRGSPVCELADEARRGVQRTGRSLHQVLAVKALAAQALLDRRLAGGLG